MKKNINEHFDYTFGVILPNAVKEKDEIISKMQNRGLYVVYAKYSKIGHEITKENFLEINPDMINNYESIQLIIKDVNKDAINNFEKFVNDYEEGMDKKIIYAANSPVDVTKKLYSCFNDRMDDIVNVITAYVKLSSTFKSPEKFIDSCGIVNDSIVEYTLRKTYNGE